MDTLDIKILKYGQVDVITLRGSLKLGDGVDNLQQTMENLASHGGSQFVLDLSDVRYMDSSGIGLVVRVLTSAKQRGGSLKLVNPSKYVTQTLKMCSLLPLFEVFAAEEEAIHSFD